MDGYRSYHLVFKYRSVADRLNIYKGLCIEIQLRSNLQHAWASSVETVSTVTGQSLKSNIGDKSWKRFFALRGTAIARWERTPLIDGTPTTEVALRDELISLCDSLKVEDVLLGWREALNIIEPHETAREYLLVLDTNKKLIQITAFGRKQILDASEQYLKIKHHWQLR